MAKAYYNEVDPFCAEWLRNLIAEGAIAPGDVDERDIREVSSGDLGGYDQCHFFAGIGGWSYALRLAGWPDNRPVWTGSCPCQPFSQAGLQRGMKDDRHLWPEWFRLIRERRPPTVFGEQVASPAALQWIDAVFDDLERAGYAVGAADLCAAGVGAPHIRQRLWFVARRMDHGFLQGLEGHAGNEDDSVGRPEPYRSTAEAGSPCGLADRDSLGCAPRCETAAGMGYGYSSSTDGGLGRYRRPHPTDSFWRSADWIRCRDGKWRPVQPGTFPLADGIPARVGRLRAYGNAIVPQAAAEFIRASM